MIITKKLAKMPYAQATIKMTEEATHLISYVTCVATIDSEGWVAVNGLYSNTTRRHLSAFAAECCNTNYQTLKKCYVEKLRYNIYTGEFYSTLTGEVWTD